MIATFTDFGIEGPYLGQVRAELQQVAPGVPVVDLFTDLPAFNVQAAAYLIPAYSQYLPTDTVCLCVVDPGVGTDRAAIAIQADGRWYVGPDNGLLSMVVRRAAVKSVHAIDWRPERLSASFHGRDLFAPVCGMLAAGRDLPLKTLSGNDWRQPDWPDDLNQIVYIDSYGNAVTGWRADRLDRDAVIEIGGLSCAYRRTFAESEPGQVFWYQNANGLVEVAATHSSAATVLDIHIGEAFLVNKS
jgi:S-adenosylmethionine hydrolase